MDRSDQDKGDSDRKRTLKLELLLAGRHPNTNLCHRTTGWVTYLTSPLDSSGFPFATVCTIEINPERCFL